MSPSEWVELARDAPFFSSEIAPLLPSTIQFVLCAVALGFGDLFIHPLLATTVGFVHLRLSSSPSLSSMCHLRLALCAALSPSGSIG